MVKELAKITPRAKNATCVAKVLGDLLNSDIDRENAESVLSVFLYAAMIDRQHLITLYPWLSAFESGINKTLIIKDLKDKTRFIKRLKFAVFLLTPY